MSTATASLVSDFTEQIGETAGCVWRVLHDHGPQSMTRLSKLVDAPQPLVHAAVGWLAREDKLEFETEGRTRVVSLREV